MVEETQALMGATRPASGHFSAASFRGVFFSSLVSRGIFQQPRPASGYFSAAASLAPPLEVAFCEQGVSPYVSYRQGDQPCLSLCEKTRRQPYVTCVAYVLMSTAVSGTRAKPKTAYFPDARRVAPIRASVWR